MKRLSCVIVSLIILISSFSVCSEVKAQELSEDFNYTVNDNGTLTITAYRGKEFNVNIPEKIDGKTVEAIAGGVFVPNGKNGCTDNIRSIFVPKTVKKIIFRYSDNESDNFLQLPLLESINVDKENSAYSSKNGVLFNKDMTSLICYPTARWGSYYVVPKTVKAIKNEAFRDSACLCEVKIGKSVSTIGKKAFVNCNNIKHLYIPKTVQKIGKGAIGCIEIKYTKNKSSDGNCVLKPVEGFEIYAKAKTSAQKYYKNYNKYITKPENGAKNISFVKVPLKKPYINVKSTNKQTALIFKNYIKSDGSFYEYKSGYKTKYEISLKKGNEKAFRKEVYSDFAGFVNNNKSIKSKDNLILWQRKLKKGKYKIKYRAVFYISGYKLKTPWSKVKTFTVK